MPSSASPVLVVGAGPVGLTAALMLARHGTPVRVIDRNDGPTNLSKALVVWQRTLETLGPVLSHDRFCAEHPVLEQVVISTGGRRRGRLPMPDRGTGVPPCVLVPQSATERILLAGLADLGVQVERNTELTAVEPGDESVACELTSTSGSSSVRTPWLVACDGSHSVTRHALGLEFPGHAVTHRWLLADFDLVPDTANDEHAIQIQLARGIAALFPMGNDRFRLIADLGATDVEGETPTLTKDEVQAVLDEHTDLGYRIASMHWVSCFGVNERQVASYVHGRVLLAGDAAHVHSPAGGQGMNTGMQDAANLAWKVALVERGAAPPALLDSYQAERHPVGAAVVKQSGALLEAAMLTEPLRSMRDHLLPLALSVPAVQHGLRTFLTEEAISYHDASPLADGTGDKHSVRSGDGWPLASGAEAELILFGDAARVDVPATFGAPDGFPLTIVRADAGHPQAHSVPRDTAAVLVRPDGVVATVARDAATAMAWLDRLR
ncbi:FAD-dependent monooxygenase [uncultured Jatrophihabitans sp.]|uniref:FAD-dependent monooxygenase n=1 Tax=uncultured Jatrophihabitans sp. TaxID=1610747 RepID=UPI0035CB9A4E